METLYSQIVASTNLDLHGDKKTKEQLFQLFRQMPESQLLNQHHDLSLPPIGKIYNKKFVELENKEYAIMVDVDIYDKQLIDKAGGFSISYTTNSTSLKPGINADLRILYNPSHISEDIILPLLKLSNDTFQIECVEVKQKQYDPIYILILKFAAYSVAAGFFGKVGSDFYDLLKSKLKDIAKQQKSINNNDINFQLHLNANNIHNPFDIIITLDPNDLDITKDISLDDAIKYIEGKVGNSKIERIALKLINNPPYYEIQYFVDSWGKVIKLS